MHKSNVFAMFVAQLLSLCLGVQSLYLGILPCRPPATSFQGPNTLDYLPCTLVEGGNDLATFRCGDRGSVTYHPAGNKMSVNMENSSGQMRTVTIHAVCDDALGNQKGHMDAYFPILGHQHLTDTYHGLNYGCSFRNGQKMGVFAYRMNHNDEEQCQKNPLPRA